jgi:signal transduction histidine kinase/CheY-like chemotaxis protein
MPTSKKGFSFLFITVLSLILICILFFVHTRSTNSIRELQRGNELAGRTFQINNALQEVVNDIITFETEYQNQLTDSVTDKAAKIKKTIAAIEENSLQITQLTKGFNNHEIVQSFSSLINKKIDFFKTISDSMKPVNIVKELMYSSKNNILNDSIYVSALSIQIEAESELQNKINQNFAVSKNALSISKGLTLLAISALLFFATIIILHLLRNQKLIKAIELSKKQADNAANIKEQFLANMSHEIRTPVNSIIGFTNLLQKTPLQKDQTNFVTYIKNSGENLLYIVNDILDISKIEAGMLQIKKEPFNISELCYYIEMMFYNESKNKQINFNYSIDKSVPEFIVGDEDRLKQILTNIIGNAFKFTNHGSVSLLISTESVKPELLNLVFTVSDTGIGIPPEKINTIFDRFEQADSKTTKTYGGTGLGLSIVKRLVNMQGGQVTVSSTVGKGSVFIFNIPVQIPEEINISELKTPTSNDEELKTKIDFPKHYKILAAEDNKMNQILLQYIFKQWNVNFTIAQNGAEVIDILKTEIFDIVLMDIQMPDIDGYQTANWIRNDLKSNIPIIAMTAYVLQGEKDKCFTYGMNEYLPKPINEIKLKELLLKYLPAEKTNQVNTFINLAFLKETFDQNKDFVKNILDLFIFQYPKDLAVLKQAVAEKDIMKVKFQAHNLKSTVLSVNNVWPQLTDLQELEQTEPENPDFNKIGILTGKLFKTEESAINEAKEILKTYDY